MKKGFTLLEIMITIGVLVVMMGMLFPMIGWLVKRTSTLRQNVQANLLLQEATEIAYNSLQGDWGDYGPGIYRPNIDPDGTWILELGQETVNTKYIRRIEIKSVCRNISTGIRLDVPDSDCVDSGGEFDQLSKQVLVTVDEINGPLLLTSSLLVAKL